MSQNGGHGLERRPEVVAFVQAGLTDDSPKTRKLAAAVLARWATAAGA